MFDWQVITQPFLIFQVLAFCCMQSRVVAGSCVSNVLIVVMTLWHMDTGHYLNTPCLFAIQRMWFVRLILQIDNYKCLYKFTLFSSTCTEKYCTHSTPEWKHFRPVGSTRSTTWSHNGLLYKVQRSASTKGCSDQQYWIGSCPIQRDSFGAT